MCVGVMKDYNLKVRELHVSHTLLIRSVGDLVRILTIFYFSWEENTGSGRVHCLIVEGELLKRVCNKSHTNSLCSFPDVLEIEGIKEMTLGGLLLQS
jgi:hypothetical protein